MAVELLETLKEAITAYTGLSPTTFFTVVALALAVYYAVSGMFGGSDDYQPQPRSFSSEEMKPLPPPVQLGEVTEEELKAYDGQDPEKPLLMAIKGQIYDISQSRMFYGPGGPYALFAGKDASRALAKMSFEEKDLNGDLTGLGVFELDALRDWEYKFMSKYAKVGTIKNPEAAPEASTSDQPAEPSAAQPAEPTETHPAEPEVAADEPKVIEETPLDNVTTVTKEESLATSEDKKEHFPSPSMASSSSSLNSHTTNDACHCRKPGKIRTSWTVNNPGRRFIGCPNSMGSGRKCNFFRWYDPELPNDWYKSTLYELRRRGNEGDLDEYSEDVVNNSNRVEDLQNEFILYKQQMEKEIADVKLEVKEIAKVFGFYKTCVVVMFVSLVVSYFFRN